MRLIVKAIATVFLAVALALFGVPAVGLHDAVAYAAPSADAVALRAQDDLVPVDDLANRQAAQAVADMIAALPDATRATADDAEAYAAAQSAYDALTDAQRAYVSQTDAAKLIAVGAAVEADRRAREAEEARAKKEAADQAAAKAVRDLIAALPAAKDAKAGDEEAVAKAKKAYEALTADQKALVGKASSDKLEAVSTAVAEAVKAKTAADKAAAKAVTTQIAKLPSATKATADDEKAAKAAKKAYEALTADQKAYVSKASREKLAAVVKAVAEAVAKRDAQQGGSSSGSDEGESSGSESGGDSGNDSGGGDNGDGGDTSDTGGEGSGGDTGDSGDDSGSTGSDTGDTDGGDNGSESGNTGDSGTDSGAGTDSGTPATPGGSSSSSSSSSATPATPTNVRPGKSISPDEVYSIDLYATATNSDGNWVRPVLDDEADADGLHWLKSGIKEKGGRLKLLVRAAWGDGRAFWQYDEDWRTLDLRFASSDTSVATVSSGGVVTATGDGEAVLSVTEQSSGLVAKLGVRVAGQQGAYVEEVHICDETGYQYEDERITFEDTANKLNLYVRQVLSDGTTVSNAPGADDYAPDSLTPTVWSVSDSDIGSVNSESGVFIPSALGSVKVYATSTGGDPDVSAGKVRGFVWVVIDDGNYNTTGDMPSDELTVNVIYDAYDQRDEDGAYKYIVKSQHYTLAELKALETAQCTYTLTRSDGGYVTSSGEGIHLLTLIENTGVDISQVKSFTFTALDGVNPGKMTYSFLFGERYYWPNYEFGGNLSEGTSVFPMLAWASDWRDSKSGAEDSSANYDDLPDGTRLRLLFGSSTTADNKTDHSLKYISEMTIRIAGAPDVTSGKEDDGSGDDDKGGGATDPGESESGDGAGEDEQDQPEQEPTTPQPDDRKSPQSAPVAGPASPKAPGQDSDGGEEGAKPPAKTPGKAPGENAQQANRNQGQTSQNASQTASDQASDRTSQAADAGATDPESSQSAEAEAEPETAAEQQQAEGSSAPGETAEASQRWRAYQMLNPEDNSNLQIDALNDNPLIAWAIALAIAAIAAGGIGRGVTFRRQLAS